jgi:hypothetical protein
MLRSQRKSISKTIGGKKARGEKDKAEGAINR